MWLKFDIDQAETTDEELKELLRYDDYGIYRDNVLTILSQITYGEELVTYIGVITESGV